MALRPVSLLQRDEVDVVSDDLILHNNQAHCVQSSPHTNSSPTVYFIYLCDQLQWIAEVLCACSKDLVIFSRQINTFIADCFFFLTKNKYDP